MEKKRVLIVDNDIGFREFLTTELSKDGYEVQIVQRLGDVLEKVLASQASLIITNLQALPNYEAIAMIKKINKNIPIITITDDDSIETERKVRQEGVFFYFVKPFTIEDMKTVISSALGVRKQEE